MSIRSNIILGLFSLFAVLQTQAQSQCGFDIVHKRNLSTNAVYKKQVDELEKIISARNSTRASQLNIQTEQASTAVYTIPVVVHIIHTGGAVGTIYNPTDAQIASTLDYLNNVYNGSYPGITGVGDLQIQFALATRDPQCNATTGIDRIDGTVLTNYASNGVNVQNSNGESELTVKNLGRWDPSKYYNIWVVNKIDGNDGTSGTFIGGFAYFPGAPASLDGTIMLATQMAPLQKTLPHEMGHAFGVYHPFQGSSGTTCAANTDCTTDGDKVCDTDPVTQSFSCRTGTNDCTGTAYNDNTEKNFMGYSSCASLFTAGQKVRMLAAAGSSSRTYSGSYTLSTTYPLTPFTPPVSSSCSPATSASGLTGIYAGVMNLALNGIRVNSGTAYADNGYRDNSQSCQSLFYLQEGQSYTLDMTLYGLNAEQAKVWIDFNNDGTFNNSSELLGAFSESTAPTGRSGGVSVSIPFSVPVNAVTDRVLRLRVVEDISTIYGTASITGGCTNPQYGQAEDYPVYIQALVTLPVSLTSFTATYNGSAVDVKWQASVEQGTRYFDVERSVDGLAYARIGTVPAGASSRTYQFVDRDVKAGTYYYRLRSVDAYNRYEYSKSVKLTIAESRAGYRVINNPASSYVDIQMPVLRTNAAARIIDMNGRILMQYALPAGTSTYRFGSIDRLSPGIYLIEISDRNGRELLRFVKR